MLSHFPVADFLFASEQLYVSDVDRGHIGQRIAIEWAIAESYAYRLCADQCFVGDVYPCAVVSNAYIAVAGRKRYAYREPLFASGFFVYGMHHITGNQYGEAFVVCSHAIHHVDVVAIVGDDA